MTLWPHQEEAVEAVVKTLDEYDRAQVIMACGTGKTRTAAEITARIAPTGRVLVIIPTLELLHQSVQQYRQHLGAGLGRAAGVCYADATDSTFSPLHPSIEAEQLAELEQDDVLITTDPGVLYRHLQESGRVTVFSTYQSLPVIGTLHAEYGLPPWELIVVDEAHRAAGRAGRAWSAMHSNSQIPAGRRVYMTATPRLYTGAAEEAVGMDDENVFGPVAYRLSFADAIEAGLLADYRVVVNVVTAEQVSQLLAGREMVTAGGHAVPASMLAAQISLLQAVRTYDLKRVLTYHHRVASARRFAETLLNAVDLMGAEDQAALRRLRPAAVDGAMRLSERRQILRWLATSNDRTTVVANARVLSEGVDVPELDAVMFVDPRDSQVDVIQAVGRALRKGTRSGKTATLLLPILLGEGESPEAALEGSEYELVWRVVRALAAHDERVLSELAARRAQATHPRQFLGEPLPWLEVVGARVDAAFARALSLRVVESVTSPWLDGLAAARRYHAEHGRLDAPVDFVDAAGYPLGRWLANTRHRRRRDELSPEQIAQLDALDIVWEPEGESWRRSYERARAFREAHGHLTPAQRQDKLLYQWLYKQRLKRQQGELPEERIRQLDDLGMDWVIDAWEDRAFTRGLAAARHYHAEHGHLDVPRRAIVDGFPLGSWLNSRRQEKRRGTLSEDRIRQLDDLGIVWDPQQRRWDRAIQALLAFRDEHGHINVPYEYVTEDGFKLGRWVSHQRSKRRGTKKGQTISAEQVKELSELGMRW